MEIRLCITILFVTEYKGKGGRSIMDFMNRDNRQSTSQSASAPATSVPVRRGSKLGNFVGWRLATVGLLFSGTILVVAVLLYLVFASPANDNKYVDKTKVQAVFLNGGQVYFGHITNLNDKFVRLSDIYYLSVNQNQQVQPGETQSNQNISLVKLGCELHRPQDSMVVNRDQLTFWENLKDESGENTVPGAIKKYVAANPNGKACPEPTTSTTPSTTPTTKKP